jgi:hypothetical protein
LHSQRQIPTEGWGQSHKQGTQVACQKRRSDNQQPAEPHLPALKQFFTGAFAGMLIDGFCAPYELMVTERRHYCLVRLLRKLEKADRRNDSPEWKAFSKKLRRVIRNGIRLRKRPGFAPAASMLRACSISTT